jgi:zinc-finger of transposase IS204/IS1001/IS1096/IS1165
VKLDLVSRQSDIDWLNFPVKVWSISSHDIDRIQSGEGKAADRPPTKRPRVRRGTRPRGRYGALGLGIMRAQQLNTASAGLFRLQNRTGRRVATTAVGGPDWGSAWPPLRRYGEPNSRPSCGRPVREDGCFTAGEQEAMKTSITWSPAAGLNVMSVERREQAWTVTVDSRLPSFCPGCSAQSKSRHSSYWRTFRDLSAQGAPVIVLARLGRWRCRNQQCDRRIFTERVPGLAAPFARRTARLAGIVRLLRRFRRLTSILTIVRLRCRVRRSRIVALTLPRRRA